ncbi:MAG: glutamate--cysteine ligase [Coxiella sp. RIFCSPHIGHO2_12_FULL_42_15]|nr:MAG: glutamate--cysteine ligase [Coxiella sp. RIFCSPHIGHO2_12_FULL_42_15]
MPANSIIPHLSTALNGPLMALEKIFLDHQITIESWFRTQWTKTPPPFYSSVDLRNAGYKLAPVDTNLFPAGFNNLNPDFIPLCIQAVQATIAEICSDVTRLLLIPESHSRNIHYFESLSMLYQILSRAGFDVRIGSLDSSVTEPKKIMLAHGASLTLEPLIRQNNKVGVNHFFPCCVILNNDLSEGVPEILQGVEQTIMPSIKLGWSNRLKSEHFEYYQIICNEFALLLNIDPWLLNPLFDKCPEVDFMKQEGQTCLYTRAQHLLNEVKYKYEQYQIKQDPFLVVKADAGTYGMAVMMFQSPEELLTLNRKQRTRMSTIKGGKSVTKAIIQEGVYTQETWGENHAVAEPVVYHFGRHVVGGFYRVHTGRGPTENLNSPGMNFEPLAFVNSCHTPPPKEKAQNRFYAYGVVARLAVLAAAKEIAAFKNQG